MTICIFMRMCIGTPRYPSLLAKCLHALFVANVHEILMHSHIPLEIHIYARSSSVIYTCVYGCRCTHTFEHRQVWAQRFFPFFLEDSSIYKAVTNEPWKSRAVLRIECAMFPSPRTCSHRSLHSFLPATGEEVISDANPVNCTCNLSQDRLSQP